MITARIPGFFRALFLTILSAAVFAPAQAKEINMAIGFSLGPYAVSNGRGMLVDITREAIEAAGHTVNFTFMTNKESIKAFEQGVFDAVAMTRAAEDKFYYSEPVITIENVAITLKSANITINSLADLGKYEVMAFSGARTFLGPEFATAVSNNPRYIEVANQQTQVHMLYDKRAQVMIAGKTIFSYYLKKLQLRQSIAPDSSAQYQFAEIFPPTVYVSGFKSKADRDEFNRGLAIIKKDGRYDRITATYAHLIKHY